MNILHRRNLGFIYDICQIVTCKTAKRDSWIEVFVRGGHEAEDLRDLEQILERFDEVDPSLLLFGYRDRKKGSMIGNIFMKYADEYIGNWEVSNFCDYLADIRKMKKYVAQYYLECEVTEDILKKREGK